MTKLNICTNYSVLCFLRIKFSATLVSFRTVVCRIGQFDAIPIAYAIMHDYGTLLDNYMKLKIIEYVGVSNNLCVLRNWKPR